MVEVIVLSTSDVFSHINLPGKGRHFHPHFMDAEIRAHRIGIICSGSHSKMITSRLKP